jgi:hypothetical protein
MTATAAEGHVHGVHTAAAPAAGQRWSTDDALRQAMERIRAALEPALGRAHAGDATPDEYRAVAAQVETQVAFMIENCKLPPDADAALHVTIGQMLEGADAMKGGANAKPRQGAIKLAAALDRYGREFDHPGWRPLHQ